MEAARTNDPVRGSAASRGQDLCPVCGAAESGVRSSIPLYDERIRAIGEVVVVSSLFALSLACLFFLLALVNTHPGAEPRVPMAAVEIVLCGAMIATGVVGAVFWSTLRMRRVVDRCVRCGTLRDAQ